MSRLPTAGRRVTNQETQEVRNPYTGEVVGVVPRLSAADALDAGRELSSWRSSLTAYDRATILTRTATAVAEQAAAFAELICAESGLAIRDCAREVERAVTQLQVAAEESKRISGEAIGTDVTAARQRRLALTIREPVGVVLAITPFNRPLNQVVTKLAPAIAANNRVLLKPSEKTPLTAIRFVETLRGAGLPEEMVAVLTGEPSVLVPPLLDSGYVDMLTFTGSAAVGQQLARRAGMVPVVCELGDSGALVVMDDADLDRAATAAATGAFATSGQSCRGVKRLLVHEAVAVAFRDTLVARAQSLCVGDPRDPETDIGTLVDESAAVDVERRVRAAVAGGARTFCGDRREGAQYWPTVLDHVPGESVLVREETFGPCAPIIRVASLDEAISRVNSSPYGLQTGVFTDSLATVQRAVAELETGAVIINDGPQFEAPNIPFGGVKSSGLGREGVKYAIESMTRVKTVVF